ncbi:SIS domain-containing protein [Candidatus Parcubacteria bacterium]|nr:SIS domain-containing protein [Candidatus Parcubacteria bacterium]
MNLDDKKSFEKLDKHGVAKSIELLPDQIRQVLRDSRLIKIPKEYSKITQVVVSGMGGSSLGAYITRSAFGEKIKAPISILSGYQLPAHIDKNTLFVLSSYSGTTEETLSTYKEAKKREAKIIAITADMPKNKLKNIMLKDNLPGLIFKPEYNPSGQPRMGTGYMVFGLSVILAKAGLFKINVKEVKDIISNLEIGSRKLSPNIKSNLNKAKKIALELYNKTPILVGAEHLSGNLRALRNQINENAKLFASYLELPDMNHYAMEGLVNPTGNKKTLHFLFFDSKLYHKRTQKRSELTKQVVKKNGIKISAYELTGKTKPYQAFKLLQMGSWISYYLGILYGVDPIKIPWVDWFKEQLKHG